MRNEELGIRNEGGGFAANIYRAMPEGSIQVTSHQSLGTPNPKLLIPAFRVQGSGFRAVVQRIKI